MTVVLVTAVNTTELAATAVVTAVPDPDDEPKLAGLGSIVVSMKLAVVNFPAVVLDAVVSVTAVDTAERVGGDLYPTTESLEDGPGTFLLGFLSLLCKNKQFSILYKCLSSFLFHQAIDEVLTRSLQAAFPWTSQIAVLMPKSCIS